MHRKCTTQVATPAVTSSTFPWEFGSWPHSVLDRGVTTDSLVSQAVAAGKGLRLTMKRDNAQTARNVGL
jgi:hypothetical protein